MNSYYHLCNSHMTTYELLLPGSIFTASTSNWEEKNLGQMKTVYPTAFNFRQEKNIPGLFDKRSKYHLTVECSMEEDERKSSAEETKKGESGSRVSKCPRVYSSSTVDKKIDLKTIMAKLDRTKKNLYSQAVDNLLPIINFYIFCLDWRSCYCIKIMCGKRSTNNSS